MSRMDLENPASDPAKEFGELYERYRPNVRAWARRHVGASEAEDLVSEVFLRAWRGYGRFRGESSFTTWLYRILANLVRDRAFRREAELTGEEAAPDRGAPETGFESRHIAARIDEAVARLSAGQRQVFLLREFDGRSHAEIAREMGIAENTAKVHYFHALRRLREELHDLV